MNRATIANIGTRKPDARLAGITQPQWSCLDIADSLNLKKKIKMNKEKIFTVVTCIGFWGSMMHPVMIAVLAVGVWGLNKYGKPDNETV